MDHIISQYCVVELQDLAQMGVDRECPIVDAKVFLSGNLDLHLSMPLSDGSLAGVDIVIDILDVEYYELRQSISSEEG